MNRKHSRRFTQLMLAYDRAKSAGERRDAERLLWREFGQTRAVFVLDMSGFSLLSQKFGVVHYLAMVRRMQDTVEPIIRRHRGAVIKFEADNCYAIFPRPEPALRAGIEMNLAFEADNVFTPEEFDIRISIGIDHGKLLIIEGKDLFGNVVNRASKLGEDLAGAGEILITREAMRRIPPAKRVKARALTLAISGIELNAWAVDCRKLK